MPEVRVRLVTSAQAEGVEKMRSELEATQRGAQALNDTLEGTADAHGEVAAQAAAANQATQAALTDMQRSARDLEGAFSSLPQELQKGFRDFVSSLEQLDITGAITKQQRMIGLPPEVRDQMHALVRQAAEVSTLAPTVPQLLSEPAKPPPATVASTDGAAPPPSAPRAALAAQDDHEGDRARRSPEHHQETPTATLRRAVDALKGGDADEARRYQQAAARAAVREGDEEAFEAATEMTGALRQHEQRDAGVESRRRYERTLEHLERRLKAAEEAQEDEGGTGRGVASKTALGRAQRTLSTVDATLQGGISRASELEGAETRLGRARAYLAQAERAGAPDPQLRDLREQLEALTAALEETRESYERGREGGGNGAPGPRTPEGEGGGNKLPAELLEEFKRLAGGGLGQLGPAGRLLGRLGPWGVGVGAAVGTVGLAERMVSGANLQAREEYGGAVDLARMYGYDGEPLEITRARTGLSQDELIEQGWTARDASRVLATLDTPAGGDITAPRKDALDVLTLSRSTGLDEAMLARALQSLRHAGTYAVGDAQEPLETVKLALAEAVKNGVSQADTLRNLVALTEEAVAQGRTMTAEGLAFQSALQATLAGTGVAGLKGDAGMRAQVELNSLLTGGDDVAMQMLLLPAVEGLTAEDLGLEGDAAEGLRKLEEDSPIGAGFEKLRLLADGRDPEALARLAARLEAAVGGNQDMLSALLDRAGISGEAKLALLGRGLSATVSEAAADTARYLAGEALDADPQGGNVLDERSRQVLARERDEKESTGWGRLGAFGDLGELSNRSKRAGSETVRGALGVAGTYDDINAGVLREQGSLRSGGTPSSEPVPPPARDPIPPATAPEPPTTAPTTPTRNPEDDQTVIPTLPVVETLHPMTAERGLELLGATKVTMQPGERYGESLRGTSAEGLIGQEHRGVDLRIGEQGRPDPIRSPWENAEVVAAGESPTYGHYVNLKVPGGDIYQMGHLDQSVEHLRGQTLGRGDLIGMEGTSGASTGYHLDMRLLETDDNARRINRDPDAFLERFERSLRTDDQSNINRAVALAMGALEQSGSGAEGGEQVVRHEVTVTHKGLDHIIVEGLEPRAKGQAEQALRGFAEALRGPESHRGFGS